MAMRELNRKKAHREWMIRNLTTSVILYERVVTTEAKAKEVRRVVDNLITIGKQNNLASWRRLLAWFPDANAAKKIKDVLLARYADRTSGFTRLVRLGVRPGDGAMQIVVELLPSPVSEQAKVESATKVRTIEKKTKGKTTVTVRRKTGAQS